MIKKLLFSVYRLKWVIACVVALVIYLLIIVIYAENIPYADDLAVLSSLYDIQHASNWYLKLKILFNFHNEHRIAIPRVVAILMYYIQRQHVNITWWIIIGNASVFLVLYLYFKAGFANTRKKLFIPVLFFVLQPMHCELMYWGMASLQNIGVLALSSLSFYYLLYSKNKFIPLLIAVLAVFTSANGLFTFIIGTALLFYEREWNRCMVWTVVGIISGFLYWHGFELGENSGDGFGESLHIIRFLTTFISLTGGIVYTPSFPIVALILGVSLLFSIGLIGYYILIGQPVMANRSRLFFLCCLAFILLTMAAISLGRNPSNILSGSRYKLYPALTLALTYVLLVDWAEKRQSIFKLAFSFGLLFWCVSYAHYTNRFSIHSRLLFAQFYNWKYSDILDVPSTYAQKYYSERWHKFYQAGQYIPPERVLNKCQKILSSLDEQTLLKASFYFSNQDVNINPIKLPIHEYYAVHRSAYKTAIYPLNTSDPYKTILSSSETEYSTSINSSYWLKDSKEPLFVIPVD